MMSSAINKKLPLYSFAIGTAAAIAIAVAAFSFFNYPQCPSYTSPQDSCIIGANIGLGLYVLLATGVWVIGNCVAVLLLLRNIWLNSKASKQSRILWGALLVFGAGLGTYGIVWFLLGHVSDFVRPT